MVRKKIILYIYIYIYIYRERERERERGGGARDSSLNFEAMVYRPDINKVKCKKKKKKQIQ